MIIVTICSDQLNGLGRLNLAKNLISRIRECLLKKKNLKIGRLQIKHRVVAEIEFFLANPEDHAFGLFSGYEVKIDKPRVDPREIKRIAITMEGMYHQRIADIDVYSFNAATKELKKHTRHSKQPKLITRNYERAA